MTEALSPLEIGERLRIAREAAKVTQAAAAVALEVARTTVVAIEPGQRRAKLSELQRLAALYGMSLNALLRREAIQVDLKPRFRRLGEHDEGVDSAVALLTALVQAELELEDLLGVRRSRNALYGALAGAKMRVAAHRAAEVIACMGPARAEDCTSFQPRSGAP